IIVAEDEVARHHPDVMGQVSRQINGLIHLGDDPPTEGVGPRAKTEDGKVRHLENVLSIAAVASKQHASTAMGIGKLATHLPEVCGLHITSTIKTEQIGRASCRERV